jgi:hypothetical protein
MSSMRDANELEKTCGDIRSIPAAPAVAGFASRLSDQASFIFEAEREFGNRLIASSPKFQAKASQGPYCEAILNVTHHLMPYQNRYPRLRSRGMRNQETTVKRGDDGPRREKHIWLEGIIG